MFFFSGVGGGGCFWKLVVGVRRPALLILTLFQSNIYKVNVREYSHGEFMFSKWTLSIINLVQLLMRMCLKQAYCAFSSSSSKDATMSNFWGCSSLFVKFKPFDEFFLFQNVNANLFEFVAGVLCVCVCVHPLNKNVSQAIIGPFFSALFKRW